MNEPKAISASLYLESKRPFRVELHGLEPVFPDLEEALSNSELRKDFDRFRRRTDHRPKRIGDATPVSKPIRHFFQLGTQLQNTGEMLRIFVRAVGPLVFYFVYKRNPGKEELDLISLPTAYLEKGGVEKHWTTPFYFHMAYLTDTARSRRRASDQGSCNRTN